MSLTSQLPQNENLSLAPSILSFLPSCPLALRPGFSQFVEEQNNEGGEGAIKIQMDRLWSSAEVMTK